MSDWYYEHTQTDSDYEVTDTATVTVGTWSDSHSEKMTVVSVYTEYVSKELMVNYEVPNQVGDIYYSFEYTVKTTNNKNDEVRTTTYTTIDELNAAGIEHDFLEHEWYLPYSPDEVEYSRSFTIDGVSKKINITMPMLDISVDATSVVFQRNYLNYSNQYKVTMKGHVFPTDGGYALYSKITLEKLPIITH